MWPFNHSKTYRQLDFFRGMTDYHSHLLPGVDDGIKTTEESLAVLARFEGMGIKEVWLTPHIMEDFPNTPADLRARFAKFQESYKGPIVLHLAAENMLDALFLKRLEAGDLLPIGRRGDHLFVETSYYTPPMGLWDILKEIKHAGYYPVLAHVERFLYMDDHDYRKLKNLDVVFQMNTFSLTGQYGLKAQENACKLLKAGYYDIAGTDIHTLKVLDKYLDVKIRHAEVLKNIKFINL